MPSSDPPPTPKPKPNRKRKLGRPAKVWKRVREIAARSAAGFFKWTREKAAPRLITFTKWSGRNALKLTRQFAAWLNRKGLPVATKFVQWVGAKAVGAGKWTRAKGQQFTQSRRAKKRATKAPPVVAQSAPEAAPEQDTPVAIPPPDGAEAEEATELSPVAMDPADEAASEGEAIETQPELAGFHDEVVADNPEDPVVASEPEGEPGHKSPPPPPRPPGQIYAAHEVETPERVSEAEAETPHKSPPPPPRPQGQIYAAHEPEAPEPEPVYGAEPQVAYAAPDAPAAPGPSPGGKRLPKIARFLQHPLVQRWAIPAALLLIAGFIGLTLLGKMRRDVWTYYTDDQGTRAAVDEEKTRFVLWEDPRPHVFEEKADPEKPEADSINQPAGRLEAAFSPNGAMMVIVRWEETDSNADMYLSRWDGRVWSRPEAIASVNSKSNERGPAFSRDGRYLYFSSDRAEGEGGYDLYVARWNGKKWDGIESLGSAVNSGEDEMGPALSSDDTQLYFSSNREGAKAEDIFVAKRKSAERKKESGKLPPVPDFENAEAVSYLNSRNHDVQAALTSRGNHVFLASDRDRSRRMGYGVYFSRVVDGVSLPPEKVDLYIEKGDVTDPAVRMEGFDLVFSADHEADSTEDGPGFRLYRSTTREVIGYTDLSRWQQFKELLGDIAWWILLALVALIALIYLLESWQDITSLFHKCLAGSVAAHLLLLLAFMAMLIAKEIEKQAAPPPPEILVSVDALTEEELALESVPDESDITQPDLSLPAEKAQAAFDVPDFQPQDNAQAVPIDAQFQQEAAEVEVRPANAQSAEEALTEPAEPSNLLSELSETSLPEPDQPVLDERELAEAPEPANPAESEFRPQETMPATERRETEAVADTAEETPPEVAEVEPSESIADNPAPTPLTEVQPNESDQAPADQPDTPQPLESQLLAELPDAAPADAEQPQLEEGNPNPNESPANPADDLFNPANSVPNTATAQTDGEAVGDSASQSQADASEVASGGIEANPIADGPAAAVGEAQSESDVAEPAANSGPLPDLPANAVLDPGAPKLDEGDPNPNDAPANPSDDLFKPNGAVAENATAQLDGPIVSDAAVPNQADAAEVASGEVAPNPVAPGPSPAVGEAQADESVPENTVAAGLPNNLPESDLLDPGAPRLEEGENNPANARADPGEDMFNPNSATAQPVASQLGSGPASDSAESSEAEAAAVAQGKLASEPASPGAATAVGEAESETEVPEAGALANNLPETDLLDPGAPALDEGPQGGAPADDSRDQFEPGGAQAGSEQAQAQAVADKAEGDPSAATEVARGELSTEPANQGAAATVGEAEGDTETTEAGALANNLPESDLLDPGAPALDEGPQGGAPADDSRDQFKPGGAQAGSEQAQAQALADNAEGDPSAATEVARGELSTEPANQGAAAAVGEAEGDTETTEAGALANNLPETDLLDPGAPALDEGPQGGAPADSSKDQFKPSGGQTAATRAQGSASADSPATTGVEAGAVAESGLVAQDSNLTGPQKGLEAGLSESPTTAGTIGPPSLDPSLTGSLLPGKLEAPEGGAMTDFLKKQRGRPSLSTIKQLGGSDGTEKAIRASIKWLAENQESSGHWNARKHGAKGDFDTGVTGLALLCFYGWGARHDEEGEYREHVSKALDWLLAQQKKNGDLSGGAMMYCHSIASIALCEAYGITKDPRLKEPAQRAIAYTLAAQSKTKGGWRYKPGNDSDTSITGWQYMAIHSARLAGIKVPEESFERARKWLDHAGGGKHGGIYGYQAPRNNSPAMVATGMFCRQLDLVPPTGPMQIESAGMLKMHPIKSRNLDYYYIYYATLALYQHQGPIWEAWNVRLKEIVPGIQHKTGSRTGSWEPSRGLAGNGGRVTSTALATLSLEVYYRILPMYGFRGDEETAPEVKKKRSGEDEEDDE